MKAILEHNRKLAVKLNERKRGIDLLSKRKKECYVNGEKRWESCVLCGKETKVLRSAPIGERKYYVEAAGQLCEACYSRVYVPVHNDDYIT